MAIDPRQKEDPKETPSGTARVAEVLRTPFAAGEIINGRYRLDRVVAEGGMGVIVAATHLELDETVAIKFLKHDFAVDPEIVGRFAREAKAAARLKSEYTAAVHDIGLSADRGPYIVMEFLEGEDFESMLRRYGRINFSRATELVMQAGVAIAVAHANHIIHRDVKPANLFLMKSEHGAPTVKVLDFGVSKARLTGTMFGGAISLVKTQSLVGSPAYMSPEQLRGNEELDAGADIWSLGAVLYQLLTGTIPFTGRSVTELFAAMLETEPRPVIELVSDVPQGLSDAVMRCFARNPKDRWQTVAEFIVALAPYAPRRARSSVEKAISVSKAGGLIPADTRGVSSRPPSAGDTEQIHLTPSGGGLPKLFQTLVDTHGGSEPSPEGHSPSKPGLPRLFQTLVDTHGGAGGDTVLIPEKRAHRARLPLILTIAAALAVVGVIYFWPSSHPNDVKGSIAATATAPSDPAPVVETPATVASPPLPSAPEPAIGASASPVAVASSPPTAGSPLAGKTPPRWLVGKPLPHPSAPVSVSPVPPAPPPAPKPPDPPSPQGDRTSRAIDDRK